VETPVAETGSGGGFRQYLAAENFVVKRGLGDVISQSFSLPEPNFGRPAVIRRLRRPYREARRRRVTVLAASNDEGVTGLSPKTGAFYRHRVVWWPASDPLVTGVGGTRLLLGPRGRRLAPDAAWNDTTDGAVSMFTFGVPPPFPWAGGGGVSRIFRRPSYQDPVRPVVHGRRAVPDVSLSGSLSHGILVFQSTPGQAGAWFPTGGTSGATPMLAGIVAIADQYAKRRLGLINPYLYRLEHRHAPGIVDVTRGDNSVAFPTPAGRTATLKGYPATRGYDLATGVGTVNGARFVPELARAATAGGDDRTRSP
jgi:subtilase family serine protease